MNKKLAAVIILSLILGAGLAGGLYVVKTPTNITPKATDGTGFSSENPLSRPGSASGGATPTTATPSPGFFSNPQNDLNNDGAVNTLDLIEFRKQ